MKIVLVLIVLLLHTLEASLANGLESNKLTKFTDPNFKLVVMESLLKSKKLDFGTEEELANKIYNRAVDLEEEGWTLKPEIYNYLAGYPLTESDLASVKEIVFDGGNSIYPYIYFFWGGETEDFDVNSLADLKLCPNLESIWISSMVNDGDLSSLSTLKNLRALSLSYGPKFYNLDVLLGLPKLEKIEYFSETIDSKYDKVLKNLKERGVEIRTLN